MLEIYFRPMKGSQPLMMEEGATEGGGHPIGPVDMADGLVGTVG